jgi:hypothetical protein
MNCADAFCSVMAAVYAGGGVFVLQNPDRRLTGYSKNVSLSQDKTTIHI